MLKKTKKILFIIPPFFHVNDYLSKEITAKLPLFTVPYGVLSLAAYGKAYSRYDVKTRIIDLNLEVYKRCEICSEIGTEIENIVEETMKQFRPDIVGISLLFNTCYKYLGMISTSIKKMDADAVLVVGGGLATNLANELLADFPYVDAACFGEGEIPLCQLLDADDADACFKAYPAWITRNSLRERRIPQGIFVQNLDDIPFFDYSLIDVDEYTGRAIDKVHSTPGTRQFSIHTSRGCPFDCVFCASGTVHGKKMRFMSVERVVAEVEELKSSYGMNVLAIEDDHFLADKGRAKHILRRLAGLNLRIEMPNGTAVYAIDDEIGSLLANAGVSSVSLAVESGSDYVLKNIINKPLKARMIRTAALSMRKNGINVHALFIIGFPGETEEHREETMRTILDVGFDWVYFNIAVPIAGSRLYDLCKEKGYLVNADPAEYISTKCNIRTPGIDPAYIEQKAYLMNLEANFVRNYNLRAGDYHKASLYFGDITKNYPDHAFAHYFLAKSLRAVGKGDETTARHENAFLHLVGTNTTWERYAKHFNLVQ
ncbi:MAG: radical SAM protein [Syntrophorhabdales bacterium]|jgi:radical SAM superfamily enzyme YgiQ (UPF0313 family)